MRGGSRVEQRLGGGGFQLGRHAALQALVEELEALAEGIGGRLGDGELPIQGKQLKIVLRDLRR